jgi:hypothetical protein
MSLARFTIEASLDYLADHAGCVLAAGSVQRVPVDIVPEIDIPAVSVVWTYNGMSAPDTQNRIRDVPRTAACVARRRYRPHRGQQLSGSLTHAAARRDVAMCRISSRH